MVRTNLFFLILLSLLFSGCSKYGYVHLNYPKEPMAFLPDGVRSIAVVNRSLTNETDRNSKVLESIATGEIAGSDRLASDECLKGVFDGVQGQERVQIVIPQQVRLYGSGTRETPELLDWNLVSDICESSKADVLLVLETFDSNTDLLLSTAANQVKAILNNGIPRAALPGQIRMNVLCYWRLYDPSTKTIVDQFQQTNYLTFNTAGKISPPEALPETAYAAGQEYIRRFLPDYYTVKRELYKKAKGSGKYEFQTGYRRAEVANWQGAIDAWARLVDQSKREMAGRSCLNIAVGYEVLGKTELALQWAKRSYEDFNDELGRTYAKILLRRKSLEY